MRYVGKTRLRRWSRGTVAALCLGGSVAAHAQMANNIPSGSPIDPGQSQNSSGQSQRQNGPNNATGGSDRVDNPYGTSSLIQPFGITGSDPNSIYMQQLLLSRAFNDQSHLVKAPASPGEFEKYLEGLLGRKLKRYGTDLILPAQRDFAAPAESTIPADYIVRPGDTLVIALTGSMEGSVARTVETNGTIFLTGVGPVKVAGVRNADLDQTIARAVGAKFRAFQVSVTIQQLRGIRIYVTGLANNPGAFTVSSLSTLANAVFQAGGPSSGGSWRSVKLYRNGRQVTDFDLYQLMRGGHAVADAQLQNEDVLFIPPAGQQVAVIGSVQEEAIYEAKDGESVADMLAAAGGPNTLADRSRVILYRNNGEGTPGPREIETPLARGEKIAGGDIIQVLSAGTLAMPTDRQSVLVRIEGEVNKPGIYFVAPNTPTSEIISKAGGLTTNAYTFGTRFTRQSVKIQQQDSFREAIRQLELTLAAAPLTADQAASQAERDSQVAGARAVLDRLRQTEPDGRIVLNLTPGSTALPGSILLENNDRIYVPPRASTVGVFGAVYRPASFLLDGSSQGLKVEDYIEKAGGEVRAADKRNIFVVRASGEVISSRRGALKTRVVPGDVVFVPIKTQSGTFWAKFKDVTTTLFQLGLSAATVVAVTK